MPISVRMDKRTETFLEETSRILRTSKTDLIKRSLSEFCTKILMERKKRPFELIEDLLEKGGSGQGDLAIRAEEILRKSKSAIFTLDKKDFSIYRLKNKKRFKLLPLL